MVWQSTKNNMKTLKFAPHLVPLVISGEKTSTWRLFDDKDLKVGDKLNFINKETGEEFAKAEITSVSEEELGKITNFEGHEKYKDQEEMLKSYRKYYGEKVNLDSVVKMIKFKLL